MHDTYYGNYVKKKDVYRSKVYIITGENKVVRISQTYKQNAQHFT